MQPIMTITGRLGTDVEVRETRNGVPFARFRLAHTPRTLQNGQWVDGDTLWLSVRAYRRLGRNAEASLRKGDPVIVTGRVHCEAWVDKDGVCHEQLVIEATSIGHDLNYGETMFRRASKAPNEDAATSAAEQALTSVEVDETDEENLELLADAELDGELETLTTDASVSLS